ncbi:sensor histidine kinase [Pseudoalteromonas fenneropenaei]|uniref:Sensor histidine kinase n=1 Tax=Pseudoalteromonas fenneropenaei TaxID=1737459 RepID=A0ABV7CM82_9GAMM
MNWKSFSVVEVLLQLLCYLIFILLYGIALYRRGEQVLSVLLLMTLLCLAGSYLTYGTHSLYGFIAYFCGFSFNRSKGIALLLMLMVAIAVSAFVVVPIPSYYYWGPAFILSIGLFSFGMMEQRERIFRQKEAQSQQQLEQLAAIAERERIARDLHDMLGHSLSSIALKAELASKLMVAGQNQRAVNESVQVAELARALLSDVREAVTGLKRKGLVAEIEQLQQLLQAQQVTVELDLQPVTLNAKQETTLAMVVKEAGTNILRHSNASKVAIRLFSDGDKNHLQIADNGDDKQLTPGNGIQGIQARIAALNGACEVRYDQGVVVNVHIPLSV